MQIKASIQFLFRSAIVSAGLIVYLSAAVINAATVYSNFGPGDTFSVASRATGATESGNFWTAMPFTVSQSVYLDEVKVAVVHINSIPPNILNVGVYSDSGVGEPGGPVETMTITNAPPPAFPEIRTAMSVSNPALTVGEDYWLVLSSEGGFGWALTSLGQTGFKFSADGGGTWQDSVTVGIGAIRSVFSIEGTPVIPEPASWLLLAFGGLVAVAGRRR